MLVNIILIPVTGKVFVPIGLLNATALSPFGKMKAGFHI